MLKSVSSITNAIGALNYKGTWDAFANTPTIVSSVGTKGDYYVVSIAGTTNINGISNWGIGDWIVFNGAVWQRVEGGADLNGVNVTFTGTASGPTYETSNLASGLTITNNSITADGTDANINVQLVAKGTGQVIVNAGAVGTPAIAPTGDTNTGIFFPSGDTIGLSVGGVEAARLVSGLLQISANSAAASAVRLFEDTDNGTNYVDIIAPSAITSNIALTIPDASGTIDRLNRAGNVLQVVQNSSAVSGSTTSTSFVDITNAAVTITPSSTANKILVLWTSFGSNTLVAATNVIYYHQVLRSATVLAGMQQSAASAGGGLQISGAMTFSILDAPNTTSAVTYKIQHQVSNASSTGTANNGFLTLMEIVG
jgi:hypothetical protein